MAYSEKVIDHYNTPRNVGSFGASKEVAQRKDIGVGTPGSGAKPFKLDGGGA